PELSWTHYRLMLKVENPKARRFYIQECIESKWSTRQLERQINSFYYERLLSSQNKQAVREEVETKAITLRPENLIKDPYLLEFLDLKENSVFLEKDLEAALIGKLQAFLLELGKGFAFVARQQRIIADGEHFYVDLV
ncbi:MAG: YhcG family protein, partial [Candidatus Parabeggiatoa sp.]|nr:YhcG family protein [Candidatus Parabeggiatoa sp.]